MKIAALILLLAFAVNSHARKATVTIIEDGKRTVLTYTPDQEEERLPLKTKWHKCHINFSSAKDQDAADVICHPLNGKSIDGAAYRSYSITSLCVSIDSTSVISLVDSTWEKDSAMNKTIIGLRCEK